MKIERRFEMLVVGGGMAGMAASVWGHRLGLRVGLVEKERLGGQLWMIHKEIPDYPGLVCADGAEMVERMEAHLAMLSGIERIVGEVTEIDGEEGWVKIRGGQGEEVLGAEAVVLATGMVRRRLWEPDLRAWEGRGVEYTASGAREAFVGQRVCIVGGGDGAFENALWLVDTCGCPEVTVSSRGEAFRARRDFVEQAKAHPKIRLWAGSVLEGVEGGERIDAVFLRMHGEIQRLEVGALLIKIGFAPQSQRVMGQCRLDPQGYVVVDATQRTSAPRLWAVGDVCTPIDPSLSVCVGQGCLAAREIQRFLRPV